MTTPVSAESSILVVDLDGTLLRGNLLLESLLLYLLPAPWRLWLVCIWLAKGGRPLLKEELSQRVAIDGTFLPWNQDVVLLCNDWNSQGKKVVVATASNQMAAERITAHFSFISKVLGSTVTCNLKGEAKAQKLVSEFGAKGFAYAGDSAADIAVWEKAGKGFFVGSERHRAEWEKKAGTKLVPVGGRDVQPWVHLGKALRPHQWLKNILVFIPLLAAHRWTNVQAWKDSVPVFLALCCMASASYFLNDLSDLEADRRHQRKRTRTFAAGLVGIGTAAAAAGFLFLTGLALALCSGAAAFASILGYFLFSTVYSIVLKKIAVFDTLFLALLYTYRIVAGGIASDIHVSPWLLAFSTTFFLGLAFLKRYVELDAFPAGHAGLIPGRGYKKNDQFFVLVAGMSSSFLSVVVLALYLDSSASNRLYQVPHWLWGIGLIMLFWIIRVWFLAGRKQMDDDPVWFAAKDPLTLILGLVCLVFVFLAGPL